MDAFALILVVTFSAICIWLTVGIINRRIALAPQAILRNRKSLVVVFCAFGLLAGSMVDREYPVVAIAIVVVGLAVGLAVARVRD